MKLTVIIKFLCCFVFGIPETPDKSQLIDTIPLYIEKNTRQAEINKLMQNIKTTSEKKINNLKNNKLVSKKAFSNLSNLGIQMEHTVIEFSHWGVPKRISSPFLSIPVNGVDSHTKNVNIIIQNFIQDYPKLFVNTDLGKELIQYFYDEFMNSVKIFRFKQVHEGVPVYLSNLTIHIDNKNHIKHFAGFYLPYFPVSSIPSISELDAKEIAKEIIKSKNLKCTIGLYYLDESLVGNAKPDILSVHDKDNKSVVS